MRLNKIYLPVLIAFVAMAFQSCLKDQEDVFDQPSSVRMQQYLDETKEILVSSENGWLLDYFPDRDYSYGGFLYAMKFTDADVTIGCDLAPDTFETSLYKLCADNGPTLSFDSYNSLMHFFATPSSGNYQAYDGDFEFMIMDISDDLITLRGKRTANIMYLHRLDSDMKEYMVGVDASNDRQVYPACFGQIGTTDVNAAINLDEHVLTISLAENPDITASQFFFITPEGLRLYSPIQIDGVEISALNFDSTTNTYSGTASDGSDVNLVTFIPDNYALIDEFDGEFTFTFGSTNIDVTLIPDKKSGIVTIKGLSSEFDLQTTYNKSYGCINLCSQTVYASNEFLILFAAGTTSGFYAGTGAAGVFFIKDPANPSTFIATPDNKPNSASCACNFVLIQYDGDGYYASPSPWRINNTYNIANVKSITKK